MRLAMVNPGERGFSLAMVMLVLLTTILGSMAIASRSTSGLMAARSQSSNREARDVAESGSTEIISELNKEQNRKLLVTPRASWNDGTDARKNPCSSLQPGASPLPIASTSGPTPKALSFANNNWINLINPTGTTQQYKLESATVTDTTRTALPSTLPPSLQYGEAKSLIKLQVSGRIQGPNGNTISTATITREYEVVPKCCKRSYGGSTFKTTTFGIDTRACPPGTNSGLGLILGINGAEPTASNSITIFNQLDQPLYSALRSDALQNWKSNLNCPSPSSDLCLTSGSPPLVAYRTEFKTPIPSFPDPSVQARSVTTRATGQNTPLNYIVGKGSNVFQCETNNPNTCIPLPSCIRSSGEYYCRLTSIDSKNTITTFDSSNGAINLFFDSTVPNSKFSYLDLGGNAAIAHVFCTSPTTSSACQSPAGITESDKFNIYVSGIGTLDIKGSSAALATNIFNLNGSTNWAGGGSASPNFLGRIWTNGLSVNGGSLIIKVPESRPTQFCPQINECPIGTGESPDVDWVARSITQSSNF
jgi:hypothetical protein